MHSTYATSEGQTHVQSAKAAATLAHETMATLFWAKMTKVAVIIAATVIVGMGAVMVCGAQSHRRAAGPPAPLVNDPPPAPLPAGALVRLGGTATLRLSGLLYSGVFSPNGKMLLVPSGNPISGSNGSGLQNLAYLFDVESDQLVASLKSDVEYIHSVAFSPDGNVMYIGGGEKQQWDKQGMRLLPGTSAGVLEAWDAVTKQRQWSMKVGVVAIDRIVVSPQGNLALVWCDTNRKPSLHLLDLSKRQSVWHDERGPDCVFTPNSHNLFIASKDDAGDSSDARLIDAPTGQERLRFKGQYRCIAVDSTGTLLAAGDWGGAVRVWKAQTGEEVCVLQTGERIESVFFDPQGKRILTSVFGGEGGKTAAWDIASGQRLHDFAGAAFGYDSEGQWIVTRVRQMFQLWDADTGASERSFGQRADDHGGGAVRFVARSRDGKLLVSDPDANRLWDLASGRETNILQAGHSALVRYLALSPDGTRTLTGSDDGTVRQWDVETGVERGVLQGHAGPIRSLAVHPDGWRAVTGGTDHTVRTWNLAEHRQLAQIAEHDVQKAIFSTDGATVVTAGWRNPSIMDHGRFKTSIHLWRSADMGETSALTFPSRPHAFGLSKDGRWLGISARGLGVGKLQIWNLTSGQKLRDVLETEGHKFNTVMFTPDGERLLTTAYGTNSLKLWDVASGELLVESPTPEGMSIEPDGGVGALSSRGAWALCAEYGRVYVWDTGRKVITKLADPQAPDGGWNTVHDLAFDATAQFAIAACSNGSIRLWDVQERKLLTVFHHDPPIGGFCRAVFSSDGRRIVSTTGTETLVWDTTAWVGKRDSPQQGHSK